MRDHRLVGIVARWDEKRRFGFITAAGRAEFFVHADNVVGSSAALQLGEIVEFIAAPSPRGPRAERVRTLPPECRKCEAALHGLQCSQCGLLVGT